MNPFLEIPVCHSGGGENDLPEKVVTGRLLPGEIAFHYPGYHWGSIIVLKSGYTFLTQLSSEEIDAARTAYHEMLKSHPKNAMNLKLVPNKPQLHAAD